MNDIIEKQMTPPPGLYRVMICRAYEQGDLACIEYDISVGPFAGLATQVFKRTMAWPLVFTFRKERLSEFLSAVDVGNAFLGGTLIDIRSRIFCVELGPALDVTKVLPSSAYTISADDIRVETYGGWAEGSVNRKHAEMLALYSGLPVIHADVHEVHSPMVQWCAEHGYILLPQILPYGDYRMGHGVVVVDRKKNILELAHCFGLSKYRKSYEMAAIAAKVDHRQLVYLVGTSPADKVQKIDDLSSWSGIAQNQNGTLQINGAELRKLLERYKMHFPSTDFLFVPQKDIAFSIWKLIRQI